MNIAITGHTGFLGSHLVHELGNHNVFGISRSVKPSPVASYAIDVADGDKLSRLLCEKQPHVVVHCAAKAIVADCSKDPFGAFKTNTLGVASVLQAARNAGVKKVVVVETDKVYGDQADVPTDEKAVPNPQSEYELSKALAAQVCAFYRRYMEVVSVRPANLFGPGDHLYTRIVPAAMLAIIKGEGIPIHESAKNMVRDFLYVKDAARMIRLLVEGDSRWGIYNLSRNEPMSIPDLANVISMAVGNMVPHRFIPKPGEYSEIPEQSINGSRFVDEFKFRFTPMSEAMIHTYLWYRENTC